MAPRHQRTCSVQPRRNHNLALEMVRNISSGGASPKPLAGQCVVVPWRLGEKSGLNHEVLLTAPVLLAQGSLAQLVSSIWSFCVLSSSHRGMAGLALRRRDAGSGVGFCREAHAYAMLPAVPTGRIGQTHGLLLSALDLQVRRLAVRREQNALNLSKAADLSLAGLPASKEDSGMLPS
jgi:hypothetical protein